jgi:hypothetical protein
MTDPAQKGRPVRIFPSRSAKRLPELPVSLASTGQPGGFLHRRKEGGIVPALGTRLRQIHMMAGQQTCCDCSEDLTARELNYRVVLRCTAVGPDH